MSLSAPFFTYLLSVSLAMKAVRALSLLKDRSIVVVGGGISGLASAVALRKIEGGILSDDNDRLVVLEKSPQADGAAIQLGPNGLRALGAIGGEDFMRDVISKGSILKGHSIVGQDVVIPDTTLSDTGLPQVLIRWGVLRSSLADLLPHDCIRRVECGGVKRADDGSVEILDAGGQVVEKASLLVAADGINSQFKRSGIRDTGRVNIKAVVKKEINDNHENLTRSYFKGNVACFAGPAGEGHTYWAISVADVDGKSDFACEDEVQDTYGKLKAKLKEVKCDFALELVAATDPGRIYMARSKESEEIGVNLIQEDDRVVLVGDAGHAMSPAYGQGANFALEDAATLSLCLEKFSLGDALYAYNASRVERCAEMQRKSVERTQKAMKGEPTEDINPWIFAWTPESALNGVDK